MLHGYLNKKRNWEIEHWSFGTVMFGTSDFVQDVIRKQLESEIRKTAKTSMANRKLENNMSDVRMLESTISVIRTLGRYKFNIYKLYNPKLVNWKTRSSKVECLRT